MESTQQLLEPTEATVHGFVPILDRILCKDISTKKMFSDQGLPIPEQYQRKSNEAKVLAVGQGVAMGGVFLEMPVRVGDIVKYGEFSSESLTLENEEYLLIRVQDVKGVKRGA